VFEVSLFLTDVDAVLSDRAVTMLVVPDAEKKASAIRLLGART
jgi:hypothetical protein